MTYSEWIDSFRDKIGQRVDLDEAQDIRAMLVNGDLRHIDGAYISALADLADAGRAEYLGLSIKRECGVFTVSDGSDYAIADDAREALDMCEAHRSRTRKTPLREPTPPTFDEALATKLDRQAGEVAARLLK